MYINVTQMDIYKLGMSLSDLAWEIYSSLDWQQKRIIGDQFIRSSDSVGANFTEGYSRYHYLEKIKFCYIARASLAEANDYWIELLFKREMVAYDKFTEFKIISEKISKKLQNYISSIYKTKQDL